MATRSFPLTTIRSPRMALHNSGGFNRPRPNRKARRSNSHQREPVNPMPVRRRQGRRQVHDKSTLIELRKNCRCAYMLWQLLPL